MRQARSLIGALAHKCILIVLGHFGKAQLRVEVNRRRIAGTHVEPNVCDASGIRLVYDARKQ